MSVAHKEATNNKHVWWYDCVFSLAIIYGVFSFANWAGPSVVAVCGARGAMFMGALLYSYVSFH